MKAIKGSEQPVRSVGWGNLQVHPPKLAGCKHGDGDCDRCGSYDRADRRHSTVGGRGIVARLRGNR